MKILSKEKKLTVKVCMSFQDRFFGFMRKKKQDYGLFRSFAVGSNLNVEFGLLFKGFYYVKFLSFLCCVSLCNMV